MATFTNQATLSYNDTSVNSNITVGLLRSALDVSKTAVRSTYRSGDVITYAVTLRNTGAAALNAVSIVDQLGAYPLGSQTLYPLRYRTGSLLYYVNGALQPTPTVVESEPLTLTDLFIPAGGNATLIYEATVTDAAPLAAGSTITNIVTVSDADLPFTSTAQATITAAEGPLLSISKSLSPLMVGQDGQITYTFVIQNLGNTPVTAADQAVVTDTFSPILQDLSVSFNASPWTDPIQYTYDPISGMFSTVAGQISVPAATYTQDPDTGIYTITPGASTLVISGYV